MFSHDGRPRRLTHYFPSAVSFPLTVQMVIAFNGLRDEHQEMRTHITVLQVRIDGGERAQVVRAEGNQGFARIADA